MNARSAWLAPTGQTREDTRLAPLGALTPTSPVATRSGILPGSATGQYRISGFTLTGTSAMGATVSPGRAVIQGSDTQGAYPVALTQNLNLTFADGDAQYARIDLVVLRVYDQLYDASGRSEAAVEIVQGTPAATPAAPAVPSLALPLHEVTVPAGASAGNGGITWATALYGRRTATVAVGGILPVYSDTSAGSYPGQYRDANGTLQRWSGTAWEAYQPPGPIWQDYTPAWRAESGAAPSIGNGILTGSYAKLGTVVHVRIYLKIGSTTNLAAQDANANWTFSLPAPPVSTTWKLDGRVLNALCFSTAANRLFQGSALLSVNDDGVARSIRDTMNFTGDIWDKSAPFTWVANDVLSISGTYEAAS